MSNNIDLLLVNPPGYAYKVSMDNFLGQGLTCKVLLTEKYKELASFIDPADVIAFDNIDDFPTTTTAIGFSHVSQQIIEKLTFKKKIILGNTIGDGFAMKRLDNYYKTEPTSGTWLFETVSYKGRHVLCHAMIYNDINSNEKWKIIKRKDQDLDNCSQNIEEAFGALDKFGVLNGPSQIYIDSQNATTKIKLAFGQSQDMLQKQFKLVWPAVLEKEKTDQKAALGAFYTWTEKFGYSKRFNTVNN